MTFPAPTEYSPATPTNAGIPFEDLHIPVNESEQIHAWWIRRLLFPIRSYWYFTATDMFWNRLSLENWFRSTAWG